MKFVNKWNLPILVFGVVAVLSVIGVLFLFVLRLLGLTNLDIIYATVPMGAGFTLTVVWYLVLWIYSAITGSSYTDGAEIDYNQVSNSDDGWE